MELFMSNVVHVSNVKQGSSGRRKETVVVLNLFLAAICQGAVNGVHGKNLNGRTVTAAYVPIPNYHQLFPESAMANSSL